MPEVNWIHEKARIKVHRMGFAEILDNAIENQIRKIISEKDDTFYWCDECNSYHVDRNPTCKKNKTV